MLDLSNNKYIKSAQDTSKRLQTRRQLQNEKNIQDLKNLVDHTKQLHVQNQQFAQKEIDAIQAKNTKNQQNNINIKANALSDDALNKQIAELQVKMFNTNDATERNALSIAINNLKNNQAQRGQLTEQQKKNVKDIVQGAEDITGIIGAGGWGAIQGVSNIGKGISTAQDYVSQKTVDALNAITGQNKQVETPFSAIKDVTTNASDRAGQVIQETVENASNPVAKKLTEYSAVIGNMAPSIAGNAINPVLGTSMFVTSAAGGYLKDAEQRGLTGGKALAYATAMGAVEGLTEKFGLGKLGKAMKSVSANLVGKAITEIGAGAGINAIQEALIEPVSEGASQLLGGNYDYSNMGKRMLQAGIDGAVVYLLMGGIGSGFVKSTGIGEKIANGQEVSQQEIQEALAEMESNGINVAEVQQEFNNAVNTVKNYAQYKDNYANNITEHQPQKFNQMSKSNYDKINNLFKKHNVDPSLIQYIGEKDLYTKEIGKSKRYKTVEEYVQIANKNKAIMEGNRATSNYADYTKNYEENIKGNKLFNFDKLTEPQYNKIKEMFNKSGIEQELIQYIPTKDLYSYGKEGKQYKTVQEYVEIAQKNKNAILNNKQQQVEVPIVQQENNINSFEVDKQENVQNISQEQKNGVPNTKVEAPSIVANKVENNIVEEGILESKNVETNNQPIVKPQTKAQGTKARSWTDTVKQNPRIQEAIEKGELKLEHLYYNPVGNKKSQQEAIATIISKGYEKAVEDFQNIAKSSKRITLNNIIVGEQLIIEAEKRGDVKTLVNLYTDVATLGTELGQMVQALSIIKSMKPANNLKFAEKLVNRINLKIAENQNTSVDKMLNKVEISKELQQELAQQTTQEGIEDVMTKISQDIAKQIPVTAWDKVDAWRYTSMLGNLRTHLRNMLGNTVMYVSRGGKNIVQRTVETLSSSKLDERTKTFKKPSEYIKQYAKEMAQKSKEEIMGADKYSMEDKIYQDRTIFKNKVFEGARKLNTNMLKQEDWLFSRPAFTNSLAEYLTANNINTEQDINNNPEIVQKAIQYSINQAEKATFRQFSGFANSLSNLEKKNLAWRIGVGATVPFKTTTANILKTGASYSPVGLAEALFVEGVRLYKGNITTNQFIERVSEGITGLGLTGLGILLSGLGILTSGVDDDDEKHLNKVGEKAPYSIKIGDTSFDVSYIAPTNIPVFLGKEFYDLISKKGEFEPKEIFDALQQSLDPFTELTLLGGINDALKTYNNNEVGGAILGIVNNTLTNYPTQFIPTLFGQVASSLDNTVRTTKKDGTAMFGTLDTFKRKVFNKIPFATYLNEPSLNVWGEEKKRTSKTGGAGVVTTIFNSFINPSNTTVSTASELDHELVRLYQQVGEDSIFPKEPQTYFNYNNEKYQMNAKEYTQFKKTYGQYAKIELTKLINKNVYKEASNKNKVKWIEDVYEKARNLAKKEYLNSKGIPFKY